METVHKRTVIAVPLTKFLALSLYGHIYIFKSKANKKATASNNKYSTTLSHAEERIFANTKLPNANS